MKKLLFPLLIWTSLLWSQSSEIAVETAVPYPTVRIKDLARVEGLRGSQITGIGLVTGLAGQGDSPNNALLQYVISSFVAKQGITLDGNQIKSKNAAVVTVTCTLPGLSRLGDRVDVEVSSLGDAKSLEGGILLQTPLLGLDGMTYATAQGRISTSLVKTNPKTQGFISGGLVMERELVSPIPDTGAVSFLLNHPDFATADGVGKSLRGNFPTATITVVDAGRITMIPPAEETDRVSFLAKAETSLVVPDFSARVVINRGSGVVVMGNQVRIAPVALSVRGAKISLGNPQDKKNTEQAFLDQFATVEELVTLLQRIGLKTDTIIDVIHALDKAGALFGTLEIIGG